MMLPHTLPVLLIDGDCSLCNTSARLIIRLERRALIRFAALKSEAGQALLKQYAADADLPDSVVLIDYDGVQVKSRALISIGRIAGGWLAVLQFLRLLPVSWADYIYDFVARRRKQWFGTTVYCSQVSERDRIRFIDL